MTAPSTGLSLDAEALFEQLARELEALVRRTPGARHALVGIGSGGAWLAERLQRQLGWAGEPGVLSIALHRDDYETRGLSAMGQPTRLPFEVEGCHVILVDDVLYTGRTIRAAVNELFDFGRPACVSLAVLVDRGGRELPIDAQCVAARLVLPAHQRLELVRDAAGHFAFHVESVCAIPNSIATAS